MDSRVFGMREQFFEEPDKFIPERWLNDDKWMQNAHAFSSFPLCHGPKSDLIKRIIEMQLCACVAKARYQLKMSVKKKKTVIFYRSFK